MKLPGGMGNVFRQVQAMQDRMKDIEKEIRGTELDVSVGGEAVNVRINGNYELVSVRIKPEILRENDVEMLEDLVLSAVNEAVKRVKSLRDERMREMTGGLDVSSLENIIGKL